jgi:hypothetical protein
MGDGLGSALPWSDEIALCSECNAIEIPEVMKKNETLNFRVSVEFKRKLIEVAKKEHRSLTNYLETALTKLWEEQESANARKMRAPRTKTPE